MEAAEAMFPAHVQNCRFSCGSRLRLHHAPCSMQHPASMVELADLQICSFPPRQARSLCWSQESRYVLWLMLSANHALIQHASRTVALQAHRI